MEALSIKTSIFVEHRRFEVLCNNQNQMTSIFYLLDNPEAQKYKELVLSLPVGEENAIPMKTLARLRAQSERDIRKVELAEYEIDGDAYDFSTWHKTGKRWDILYSANPIVDRKQDKE